MEIELYTALLGVGVEKDKAQIVVDSLKKEIDQRYASHAAALVTQRDLDASVAKLQVEIREATNKLMMTTFGSMIALGGFVLTAIKLL
jgi:hypothetical protein